MQRIYAMSFLVLTSLAVACQPDEKCGGDLYFDGTNCRRCPMNATFKDGTCECNDSDNYDFVADRCVLRDGAMLPGEEEEGDAGAGSSVGPSCVDYCEFQNLCIGNNSLAKGALSQIVTGLHADNPAACKTACESDTGGDGSMSPIVACIDDGRAAAMCENDPTQPGLQGAMMLMGKCCKGKSDELCKSICAGLAESPILAGMIQSGMIDFCE